MAHISGSGTRTTKRLNSGKWDVQTIGDEHSPIPPKSVPVLMIHPYKRPKIVEVNSTQVGSSSTRPESESGETNQQQNQLRNADDSNKQIDFGESSRSVPANGNVATPVSANEPSTFVPSTFVPSNETPLEVVSSNSSASESVSPTLPLPTPVSSNASATSSNLNEEEGGSNLGEFHGETNQNQIDAPSPALNTKSFASKEFYACYSDMKQITATSYEAKCKFCSPQTAAKKFPKGNYSNLKKHLSRVSVAYFKDFFRLSLFFFSN